MLSVSILAIAVVVLVEKFGVLGRGCTGEFFLHRDDVGDRFWPLTVDRYTLKRFEAALAASFKLHG